ncbi:hypothetical protein F383_34391 [Gossypium arboreum]|uniref:Uncharacterized protein n=1 Tax=Gossypium arboreum TaxID=29729 RepID=A0A0B0N4I2_GOSAR|nr:hypothetical protein F383_34391 [Gossypium arboreum]
MAYFVVKDSTM